MLIGQPGQTKTTMEKTCDQIIKLKPTLVQTSLMAYKPWVAKYQVQMLAEGPLPDFLERKELLEVIHKKLKAEKGPLILTLKLSLFTFQQGLGW